MTNRTEQMRLLNEQDRTELINAGDNVHDLRPVLQEKLRYRNLLARDIKPTT